MGLTFSTKPASHDARRVFPVLTPHQILIDEALRRIPYASDNVLRRTSSSLFASLIQCFWATHKRIRHCGISAGPCCHGVVSPP